MHNKIPGEIDFGLSVCLDYDGMGNQGRFPKGGLIKKSSISMTRKLKEIVIRKIKKRYE